MRHPANLFLRYITLTAAVSSLLFFCMMPIAQAKDFSLALFDGDDQYFANILEAALNAADGDHTLTTSQFAVSQNRVLRSLLDGTANINVIYTGHSTERELLMRQIDIPLSRGLLGYRVFVVKKSNMHLFKGIKTQKELAQRISVGSGTSWPDTPILRAAGFNVQTGSVNNLWLMLARDRFVAFPRGMNEVHRELIRYEKMGLTAPVATENTIMIYYPFDHFYYVAPNDEVRAGVIEQGLTRIYKNGEFMRIFNSDPAIRAAIDQAEKHKRRVIRLENPLNSQRINNIPERFWLRFEQE